MIGFLISTLLFVKCSWCIPLDQLYPFGTDEGDRVLDSSSDFPIIINGDFNFDLDLRHEIYIELNGIITFTPQNFSEVTSTTTPKSLPIQDLDFIAPYWFDGGIFNIYNETVSINATASCNERNIINETYAFNETSFANETLEDSVNDTNCRNTSTVYYRRSFDYFLEERALREIRENFFGAHNFYIWNLFIVTWIITDPTDNSSNPKENIFQCILANGGRDSYVIFNYADGLNNDSNIVPVQAGINAAFRPTANYISIPNTSDISITSNVGKPGVWMFQTGARPFITPIPSVNITILTSSDEQIVGQPLTLECRIEAVREIDSTFDIIWRTEGLTSTEVRSVKDISGSLLRSYSDFYTIVLRRGIPSYSCEVIINLMNQSLNTSQRIYLRNATQPTEIIISPTQSPLRVKVGSHLPIYCIAVKGVPTPALQWHSEGFPLNPDYEGYQQIYVVPTDSPHTSTYTCVGVTFFQTTTSELRVNVTVIVEESCSNLQAPRNGEITITEDGQLALFSCNRGYTMRGSSVLKCINGKWNSSPPTCKAISRFCRRRCNF